MAEGGGGDVCGLSLPLSVWVLRSRRALLSLPPSDGRGSSQRERAPKSPFRRQRSLSLHAPPVLYPLSWNMETERETKRKETLGFSSLRHIQAGIEEEEEGQVPQKQARRRRRLRCWRRRQSLLLLLYVPFSLGGGGGGGSAEGKAAQ